MHKQTNKQTNKTPNNNSKRFAAVHRGPPRRGPLIPLAAAEEGVPQPFCCSRGAPKQQG